MCSLAVDHGLWEAVYGGNFQNMDQLWKISCHGSEEIRGHTRKKRKNFIARKGASVIYVQVTYLLESKSTIEREFGAYEGIKDNLPKYVISLDNFDMSRNGSKH